MEASNITWWSDGYNCSFYYPTPFLPSGLSGWRGQRGERSVTHGVAEPGPGQYSAAIGRSLGNTGLSLADTGDHLLSHLLGSKVHYGLTARSGGNILLSGVICNFLERSALERVILTWWIIFPMTILRCGNDHILFPEWIQRICLRVHLDAAHITHKPFAAGCCPWLPRTRDHQSQ